MFDIIEYMVEKYSFDATYVKDNGLWLLNVNEPDIPGNFDIVERNIVCIPGGEFGGNHKHPRSEAFLGIGEDLQLIWEDEQGNRHVEAMGGNDPLQLFVVHSLTPHVVLNKGSTPAVLIEFANAVQHDVEPVDLLSN